MNKFKIFGAIAGICAPLAIVIADIICTDRKIKALEENTNLIHKETDRLISIAEKDLGIKIEVQDETT